MVNLIEKNIIVNEVINITRTSIPFLSKNEWIYFKSFFKFQKQTYNANKV